MSAYRKFARRHTVPFLCSLVLLVVFAQTVVHAQSVSIEVITLKYRTPEQVMPVLKPLLDKTGTMSAMQNQLVVRTTTPNLIDLKRVLATLDTEPRRLMITVRQDATLDRDRTRAGIDSTRSRNARPNTQILHVLEGSSAFIRTGKPAPRRQVTRAIVDGQVVERAGNAVANRDAMTGFYVLPRLTGDRVALEIKPQRATPVSPGQHAPDGDVNAQEMVTTISGRLGEWIEVGDVVQSVSHQQSVIIGNTRERLSDNHRLSLKVDEIR